MFFKKKRFEARKWLTENKSPYALAPNRFNSTAEALLFVNDLYSKGAVQVDVSGIYEEPWRLKKEDGGCADVLYIALPPQGASRQTLFEIYKKECEAEGEEPVADTGQKEVLLWWD